MTVALIVLAFGLVAFGVSLSFFRESNYDVGGWFALTGATGLVLLVGVIMAIAQPLSVHFGRIGCDRFAAYTDRPTRFRTWNDGYSFECYARTSDGRWLPKSQLRDVAP